jgi:hypothetical protein
MSESLISGEATGQEQPSVESVQQEVMQPSTSSDFSFYSDDGLRPEIAQYIGDDNKAAKSFFEKYRGAEDPNKAIVDGIANLQYMAGQKAFDRPPEDAPDSVKQEFQNRIRQLNNAPESVDGYEFKWDDSVPEGYRDDSEINAYKEIFNKYGVPKEAWDEAISHYQQGLGGIQEQIEQQTSERVEVERQQLQSEFGVDADKMIQRATSAGNALGLPQSEIERIGQTAEGVKALAKINDLISSDVLNSGNSSGSVNQQQGGNYLEQAVDASRKASEAYAKGDRASGDKYYQMQQRFNELHLNSQR